MYVNSDDTRRMKMNNEIKTTPLFKTIKSIIDEADVEGLLSSGAPKDEYDNESATIAVQLRPDMTMPQIAVTVKDVMNRSFGENRTTEDFFGIALEIYDLLIKDRKLTQAEEQKVKLAAKNLYKKLTEEKQNVMVVDWYKDEQPKQKVLAIIQVCLNNDLPESYDREVFSSKTNLLMNHFIDMAVQGYGWLAA